MIAWLLSITKGSFEVFEEGLIAAVVAATEVAAVAEAIFIWLRVIIVWW
jgi:hypothetical protein